MASGKILRQIVKAGISGDIVAFQDASKAIIQEERQKQHHLLANDLEKIIYGDHHAAKSTLNSFKERVPIDQERGLPLLTLREPVRGLDQIILSDKNQTIIDGVIEEHQRGDLLRGYGVRPVDKLLFYGPPGCGKTLMAEVLAHELEMNLATIRIDSAVSSYLGETAANLRKIFDFIEEHRVIALFDEFDALGKERTDSGEHGELKRVVNSVLQMLDSYHGKSIIIAATNHEMMLDSAIWRRFEEILFFAKPDTQQLMRLLQVKLRGVRRNFELDDTDILALFSDMSQADVEQILRRAIKMMILKGSEFLEHRHIKTASERELVRRSIK